MKRCSRCKERKSRLLFHRDKTRKDGLSPRCKSCVRDYQYLWLYGISIEDYRKRLKEQGGVCLICQRENGGGHGNRMAVDHCHTTGEVRGLLCSPCNLGIGHFNEDPERMLAAIEYLRRGCGSIR